MTDSSSYRQKKAFFDRVLSVYGRKPVLELLQQEQLACHALHLAENNRAGGIVAELEALAAARGIPVQYHSRAALSRISRNGKQDQGVAADILCPAFSRLEEFLEGVHNEVPQRLLALDGITNPQNLGMIIRSAVAGSIDGILWSKRGNAALGPLVIKASAGTVFRAPLLMCDDLHASLLACQGRGFNVCTLEADAPTSLFEQTLKGHCVYVLGNEAEGVSRAVQALSDSALSIPMRNGVESLNVAVTAALIAYAPAHHLER